MQTPLRIGLVGLGNQSQENLLPAIAQIKGARLAAVCDADGGKVASLSAALGHVEVYPDLDAVVRPDHIDALVMACPPQAHLQGSRLAIQRGLPVFVEKPPCEDLDILRGLADLAASRDAITAVGLNFRFAQPVVRAVEIMRSDRFGGAAHIDIRHFANKPRAPLWGGTDTVRSFLLAQTIHSFDLAVSLGGSLASVGAEVDEIRPGMLIINVQLRFKGGMSASVLTGNAFPSFEFSMTSIGRNGGYMVLDNLSTLEVSDEAGGSLRPGEKRWSERWHVGPLDSGYARAGYLGELQSFVDHVRRGERFPADFASLIPTFEIIERVVERASTTLASQQGYEHHA